LKGGKTGIKKENEGRDESPWRWAADSNARWKRKNERVRKKFRNSQKSKIKEYERQEGGQKGKEKKKGEKWLTNRRQTILP